MSKHNEHLKVESIVWPRWLMLKQTLVHYKNLKKTTPEKQLTWYLMSWEWKWVETSSVLLPVHIFLFPSWSSVAHPLSPSQPLCNNRNLFPGSVRQPLWCEWPTSTKAKAPWLEKKKKGGGDMAATTAMMSHCQNCAASKEREAKSVRAGVTSSALLHWIHEMLWYGSSWPPFSSFTLRNRNI